MRLHLYTALGDIVFNKSAPACSLLEQGVNMHTALTVLITFPRTAYAKCAVLTCLAPDPAVQ